MPEFGLAALTRPISTQPAIAEDQPGDHVDAEHHPAVLDAGQPGGVGVVADGVDMRSPRRVAQDVGEDGVQATSITSTPVVIRKPPMSIGLAEPVQLRAPSSVLRTVRPVA